jgi:glutathione S-transferase
VSVKNDAVASYPPTLKLFYSPKACSLASHIALEESGLPYEAVAVDIRAEANRTLEYLAINPSGGVPALMAGEVVVTESHAILGYIADLVPELQLLPRPGTRQRAKAHEWMNWISGTVHGTYRSIFRPQVYSGEDAQAAEAVRSHANGKLAGILSEVERRLGDRPFALGEFSVVDAYLFVFYLWSFDERIGAVLPARKAYAALADRVWSRSTVRKVVDRERSIREYDLPPGFRVAAGGSR